MALVAPTPERSAAAGIMTEQLWSVYDYAKPQVAMELFRRYGYQGMDFLQLFRAMGREQPIALDEWHAYEDDYIHETMIIAAAGENAGAAASEDVTVIADANGNLYARVGDIITMPTTERQVLITAINYTTLVVTLQSVDGANLPVLANDGVFSITTGAWGAGTGQPLAAQRGATKRNFFAQIFKETIGAEGTQLVNEKWYKVYDTGENLVGWYSPSYLDAEYRMAVRQDGAYLFGEAPPLNSDGSINTTLAAKVASGDGVGNVIKTTKGIVPTIRDLGAVLTYAAGGFAISDYDDMALYLRSQSVTSQVVLQLTGAKLGNEIDAAAKDFIMPATPGTGGGAGAEMTYIENNVFNKNRELALQTGFTVIKKGGFLFCLKPMDNFSNPKTYAAAGYDMEEYGIVIPYATYKDAKTGAKLNNFESKYRAFDGYNRRYEVWTVAGAGNGLKVIDIDKTNTFFRAHHGLQVVKANQMILNIKT